MICRKYIVALIFPPQSAYSRLLTEGIMQRHLAHRDWTMVELPRLLIGRSPLPTGKWRLDGALVWAEPRDQWMYRLLDRQVKVVSFGAEWADHEGVASVMLKTSDLHREVLGHFKSLGLRHTLALAHRLDRRPATKRVLESFASMAISMGMTSAVRDIGGKLSPGTAPQRLLRPDSETDLRDILRALPKPAGIYCGGDFIGYIVCEVAARLGMRVPEDIAVVGEGGNLIGELAHPPLSTITGNVREVGVAMADCLGQWLSSGERPFPTTTIPGARLIKRESSVGKSGSDVLEAVRRCIAQRAVEGVSLNELTELSGLGAKTLSRRYQAAFGTDPLDEIHQRRLAEINRLLSQTKTPIAEIARACGFSSQAALYNYFKRHAGAGPGEYRSAHAGSGHG